MITLPRSSIVTILMLVAYVHAQSACKTPVGETGLCVPATECSIITKILLNNPKPLPAKALDYLKSSHCGTQNNVHYDCCAEKHRIDPTLNSTPAPTSPEEGVEVINV